MKIKAREGRAVFPAERDTAVFLMMRRILARWRDDPEKLAVAVYAYENVLGYNSAAWEIESGSWDDGITSIPLKDAYALVERALYRRDRRILRHRAEGLILGLRETAEAAEAWRLHGVQRDACVIECRTLDVVERLAALRVTSPDANERESE